MSSEKIDEVNYGVADLEDIDKQAIEAFKTKKRSNKWNDYRFGERISLEAVLKIVEMPPTLKRRTLSFEAVYSVPEEPTHKVNSATQSYDLLTNQNPEEVFKNLIVTNLNYEEKNGVKLFNKWELINWMEREFIADSNFAYTLQIISDAKKKGNKAK